MDGQRNFFGFPITETNLSRSIANYDKCGKGEAPAAFDNFSYAVYVDYSRSNADPNSPQAQSTGSGDGWLLRDGKIVGITWDRQFEALKWSFYDDDTGELVNLDYGRTWVALAKLGEASLLTPVEAALLSD